MSSTNKNYINHTSIIDITQFCEQHFDEIAKNSKIQGKGLGDTQSLQQSLDKGDYIPVLRAVWSEKDTIRQLQWLREKAALLHAPLMFELALAEFSSTPDINKIKTFYLVSIPLIKAAAFRVMQDAQCSTRSSFPHGTIGEKMAKIYTKALERRATVALGKTRAQLLTTEQEMRLFMIKMAIEETALRSIMQELPPPTWITGGDIFPLENCKEIRDIAAYTAIQSINREIIKTVP